MDGLDSVVTWPLDPRLEKILSRVLLIRLVNLFDVMDGVMEVVGLRTALPEPWDRDMTESGPKLDRGLPCCEEGRSDSRRLHVPCVEEIESRELSGLFVTVDKSFDRMYECRRPAALERVVGGMPAVGGWREASTGFENSGEGWDPS